MGDASGSAFNDRVACVHPTYKDYTQEVANNSAVTWITHDAGYVAMACDTPNSARGSIQRTRAEVIKDNLDDVELRHDTANDESSSNQYRRRNSEIFRKGGRKHHGSLASKMGRGKKAAGGN